MKLADEIKFRLIRWCRNYPDEIILPNFYYGRWEMDVFRLHKSGYVSEYEIKISRADFKNDFKKQVQIWGIWKKHNGIEPQTLFKHEEIKKGISVSNKFYFVVPADLIKPTDVPQYSGLIYYYPEYFHGSYFQIKKHATMQHKRKLFEIYPTLFEDLCKKLAYRENNLMNKTYRLTERNKELLNFSNSLNSLKDND